MTLIALLAAALALVPTDPAANRALIQGAVDAASAQGGGRVTLPVGTWPTGSIELKSGVELNLPEGCALVGSTNRADYNANDAFPDNVWSVGEEWSGGHLVWAYRARDIAITGAGTIDGNGPAFFGECDEVARWPWYKYGLKLHPTDRDWFRPGMMVAFFQCRGIRLEGVSLVNTTSWTCHLRCCDGVTVRGVRIEADVTIANSDGFSIDCSRNVLVENCRLRTGDDAFPIRASCRRHAATNICENIVVRNCDIASCCFAFRFGIGTGTIRNCLVENCRISEAPAAFGFTPAWVDATRNCYIEDITVRDCTVTECCDPVQVCPTGGDAHVTGVRFENCAFESLLPAKLSGAPNYRVAFVNCARRPLDHFRVRHMLNWNAEEIRAKRHVFAEVSGERKYVSVENCLPRPFGSSGVMLLSFDDRNFADWERAMPLFAKYGAHATFFVSGAFDPAAVKAAKRLQEAGHAIGLHGEHHANAPEAIAAKGTRGYWQSEFATVKRQCDVAYVPVRTFAYPNCRHDAASDNFLLGRFDRLRAGIPDLRPYDPKGALRATQKPLATDERLYFPVADLPKRRVLETLLIGEAYNTDIADLTAAIRRAGARKEVLVLASHGIHPGAKGINMKTEWLEQILKTARESDVAVLSYDEIPLKR